MPQQIELLACFLHFCPRAGITAIFALFPLHYFQVPKGVTMLRAAVTYHVHLSLRSSATNQGFTNNVSDFDANAYPEVGVVKEAYPACAVMPLSRMTVNETAVNNGDANSFSVSFFVRTTKYSTYRRRVTYCLPLLYCSTNLSFNCSSSLFTRIAARVSCSH